MLAIMVSPCYKNMKCILNFVWNSMVAKIVAKYNVKIMCPLLLQVYNNLNLTKEAIKPIM